MLNYLRGLSASQLKADLNREYVNRSVLGHVGIFNVLPNVVFVCDGESIPISVKQFQCNLTRLLRLASRNDERWVELFCSCQPLVGHVLHSFRNVDALPL